jgi:SAM-dependent methyltransferase
MKRGIRVESCASNCVICGSSKVARVAEHRPGDSNGEFHLVECKGCRVQYWTPLVHPGEGYYELNVAGIYDEIHAGRRDVDFRHRAYLREENAGGMLRVLEIGCGGGEFLARMVQLGHVAVGIDIDKQSVVRASQRDGVRVEQSGADRFLKQCISAGDRFDRIFMFDVLEHLVDPLNTLTLAKTSLNRGGRIVGTVPNRHRLFRDSIKTDFPPHHFFRFDVGSLNSLSKQAGLAPLSVKVIRFGEGSKVATDIVLKTARRVATGSRESSRGTFLTRRNPANDRWDRRLGTRSKNGLAWAVRLALWLPITFLEVISNRGFKIIFVFVHATEGS